MNSLIADRADESIDTISVISLIHLFNDNTNRNKDSDVNKSLDGFSPVTSNSSEIFCRICHQNNRTDPNSDLISPCNCLGTMAYVHRQCLQKWASISLNNSCNICGFVYKSQRKYPSIFAWAKVLLRFDRQHRMELIVLALMIIAILFIILITLLATLMGNKASDVQYYYVKAVLFSFLVTIKVSWVLYSIRFLYKSFQVWRKDNTTLELVLENG